MLKVRSTGYVTDENVEQVCRTHEKIPRQIYHAFERIRKAGDFVAASMETWRVLGLSVSLKAHIFEDPAVDSMEALNGLGHKTKDSIELSHQDGARQDRHTQGLRDHKQKYESQHKAEHQSSHPNVHKVDENTRKKRKICECYKD